MEQKTLETFGRTNQADATPLKRAQPPLPYEPPAIVTLTDRQLLAELGPAQMGGYYKPFGDPW